MSFAKSAQSNAKSAGAGSVEAKAIVAIAIQTTAAALRQTATQRITARTLPTIRPAHAYAVVPQQGTASTHHLAYANGAANPTLA